MIKGKGLLMTGGDKTQSVEIDYKYDEQRILEELMEYVDSTYGQHYSGDIQTTEFLIANGMGHGHTLGNVIKYAQRYGKKEGKNRKDILKILHYAMIALYVHDKENKME
jgi:hypothetical protein